MLICFFTAVAYTIAVESVEFAIRQSNFLMAKQDTKCKFGVVDRVTKNYAPDLIARQVAYKINNDWIKSQTLFAPIDLVGHNFVLAAKFKPDAELTSQQQAQFAPWARQIYCSDSDPIWLAARQINYQFLFVVYRDDAVLHQQLISPKDCPTWPSPPGR